MGERFLKNDGKLRFRTATSRMLYLTFCLLLVTNCVCDSLDVKMEEGRNKRGLQRYPCITSSSTIVQKICPNDTESRNLRAKEMNCDSINNTCSNSIDFVYHCLLNEWGNGSIEICAPSTKIVGQFCTEFNLGGGIIQEHHKTNRSCLSCPYVYNSSDSFRYTECFSGLPPISVDPTEEHTERNSTEYTPCNAHSSPSLIGLVGLLAVIPVALGALIFHRRKRTFCNRNLGLSDSEENTTQKFIV
ncbi:uncharacterized protein LOC125677098 [Ostrea edulis]|uniref:uncharacterized protein LOC125677098 n=1 Tax=Ostrea edulis TaxID=37623 RepID=UPI0024AF845C|nr:uncharacterized protein LOC125677098 [Ostrea edulis]